MKTTYLNHLEVISCEPEGPAHSTPLLLVHGAFAGAWCWQSHFLPYFAQHGWACHALSLSGHAGSKGAAPLDTYTIDQYVDDVQKVANSLPVRPILIGHSMGGLVVQKLLEREDAPATVLLASVPPNGVTGMAFSMMSQRPRLLWDLKSTFINGDPHLESIREGLFHQPIDQAMLEYYAGLLQPESMRAMWDMAMFNLPNPARMYRPPMLILGAEHDRIIAPVHVQQTAKTYGLEAEIFPDMGHGMMMESNWQGPAQRINTWLKQLPLEVKTSKAAA